VIDPDTDLRGFGSPLRSSRSVARRLACDSILSVLAIVVVDPYGFAMVQAVTAGSLLALDYRFSPGFGAAGGYLYPERPALNPVNSSGRWSIGAGSDRATAAVILPRRELLSSVAQIGINVSPRTVAGPI